VNTVIDFPVLADLARGRRVADALCPVCSHQRKPKNQSKAVMRLWVEPGFITFNCAHCGAAGYAHSRSNVDPGARAAQELHLRRERERPRLEVARDRERIELVRAIWEQGVDPRGTAAEQYLRARALHLGDLGELRDLRFHPRCAWQEDPDHPDFPPGGRPTLLAAFRSIETDEITAIHRIRVDVPKLWPKTLRKMLGPVKGAAVKLAPVTDGTLAIGEGLETSLAANEMGYGPAWALGSAIAVERLPVLVGIKKLVLLEENNAASREAVTVCGRRWVAAGREVLRVVPKPGCDDLNDELMLFQKGFSHG
jgi:Zn ribbon nucleic-acid-binding protein